MFYKKKYGPVNLTYNTTIGVFPRMKKEIQKNCDHKHEPKVFCP